MEMRDEVLSHVGAKDMDTNGYQVSDLDNVEFYLEKDQLDVEASFRPRIDTLFSPSIFIGLEMGWLPENLILIDEELDKGNSPPHPTIPVSQRTTQHPVLMRSRPLGTKIENVSDYVFWNFVWIS